MSGPLASWVQAHSKADPAARSVLVTLALRADHDGNGADHSFDQLADLTGYGRRTVARALSRLIERREVELVTQGGGRGNISRYRIPEPEWCPNATGCVLCRQFRTWLLAANGVAAAPKRRRMGATEYRKRGQSGTPYVDEGGRLTEQRRLAMLNGARASSRPPNGHRPGDVPPSPDPSRVSLRSTGGRTARQTAATLPPFQAAQPAPSDHGEPAAPHYAAVPAATTGDPSSNPGSGRLFEHEPAPIRAYWR